MILSNVLQYQTGMGTSGAGISLEKISPIAWRHINFYGRYAFTGTLQPIDIDAMVRDLITSIRSR